MVPVKRYLSMSMRKSSCVEFEAETLLYSGEDPVSDLGRNSEKKHRGEKGRLTSKEKTNKSMKV